MVKLQWTPLQAIFDYISKDSRQIARMFVEKIYHHVDQLIDYPQSGRTVPETEDPNIRELIYRNYRIVYRIINDEYVRILTVFHSTKNLDKKRLSHR